MVSRPAMGLMVVLTVFPTILKAQQSSFLFTFAPPDPVASRTVLHYDVALGRETFEPLGADNVEQVLGGRIRLGESILLAGRVGLAVKSGPALSSQHVEFLIEALDAEESMVDLWAGPGFRREYGGTSVLLGRIGAGRRFATSEVYGNVLLEKPLSAGRDQIDLVLTAGWSYFLSPAIRLGIEGIGQDLEGFWDEEEAEGGARLFAGPTMVVTIPETSWALAISAGPIFRATQSIRSSSAMRDLPLSQGNGFVVHATVSLGL